MQSPKSAKKNEELDIDVPPLSISSHQNVTMLGINLSSLPDWIIGVVLFSVIIFAFIGNGAVEEGFKFEFPEFSFGWFMTSFELICFAFLSAIERIFGYYCTSNYSRMHKNNSKNNEITKDDVQQLLLNKENVNSEMNDIQHGSKSKLKPKSGIFAIVFERHMDMKYHLIVAAAMVLSRSFTNISLLLLNYPTLVVFKTMKLIPVMIGNRWCLKKPLNMYQCIAGGTLVISAALFTIGDRSDPLRFNALGIVIVLISLLFDAIHANSQEYILKQQKFDTKGEMLIYSNLIAGIMAGIASFVCMETVPLMQYLDTVDIVKLFVWFLVRVLLLYVGVSAFVACAKKFGIVLAVIFTTFRKVFTVGISFLLFPAKVFTQYHAIGVVFFFLALVFQTMKSLHKKK